MINLTYFGSQMSMQVAATAQTKTDSGGAPIPSTTKTIGAAGNGTNSKPLLHQQRQSDSSQPPGASELQTTTQPEGNLSLPGMGAAPLADPSKRMKLSQLDYLANPLRTDHPFGKHPSDDLAKSKFCLSLYSRNLYCSLLTCLWLVFQKSGHPKRWRCSLPASANLASVLIFLSLW